jgi:hypothetical protein
VRFPYRDSGGDSREDAHYDEDGDATNKKKAIGLDMNPSRPFNANLSEPSFHTNPGAPASPPSITRKGSNLSPLAPSVKSPLPQQVRPISMLSLDKSLPPLPLDDPDVTLPPNYDRYHTPTTLPMATYEQRAAPYSLNAGPRFEDAVRRQSFNGLASSRSTLPLGAGHAVPGIGYNEFGASRYSGAVYDIPNGTNKRKSRFGLSSLLGLKGKSSGEHYRAPSTTTLPSATSYPRNSDTFLGHHTRTSLSEQSTSPMLQASRRTLDELVVQESDFVAYRYPSKDEKLDLSRN